MEKEYRYRLEKYDPEIGKHICPNCGHRTFVYYIDTYQDDRPIFETVGRCERINECTYHLTPYQFFKDENISLDDALAPAEPNISKSNNQKQKRYNVIKPDKLIKSMQNRANTFTAFLLMYLGNNFERLDKLIKMYNIGSSGNGVIFWQVDQNQKIRTGKMMWYSYNGHRLDVVDWYHSRYKDFILNQCFYGLHLLTEQTKTIYIVESEKTAILLKDRFINDVDIAVMATGGAHNLTSDRFKVFQGRNVQIICLPDVGQEIDWFNKLTKIKTNLNLDMSLCPSNKFIRTFSNIEYELLSGQDIADYLVGLHDNKEEIQAKFLESQD